MYDFDESGVLTLDEMVLSFRSSLSGLAKLSKIDPPTEADIEAIVVLGFDSIRKASDSTNPTVDYQGIDREEFVNFCINTPEIMSWIEYFDDLEEYEQDLTSRAPIVFTSTPENIFRVEMDEANMNPSTGGFLKLELEHNTNVVRRNWENVTPLLAPMRKPDPIVGLPDKRVSLEWVYGINLHASRQSLYYSAKGAVVYAAGAVCIIQKVLQHEQEYYVQHSDLVTCLKLYTTNTGETIVASGECGTRPAVHVWDCDSRVTLSTLQGFHRNGISQLDFSPDKEKLVTLGMDPYHSLAVYRWRTRERLWSSRTTVDIVHDVRFLSNDVIASCGHLHITFWRESSGNGIFKRYRGQFGTAVKPETLWCVGVVGKTVFSGSETGMLHVWEGRNLISSIKAHTGTLSTTKMKRKRTVSSQPAAKARCWYGILNWNSAPLLTRLLWDQSKTAFLRCAVTSLPIKSLLGSKHVKFSKWMPPMVAMCTTVDPSSPRIFNRVPMVCLPIHCNRNCFVRLGQIRQCVYLTPSKSVNCAWHCSTLWEIAVHTLVTELS